MTGMSNHGHAESMTTLEICGRAQEKAVFDSIAKALAGLRFGSVEVVVHEGKVTQIERKEKIRI
jgi:hypothetical protein